MKKLDQITEVNGSHFCIGSIACILPVHVCAFSLACIAYVIQVQRPLTPGKVHRMLHVGIPVSTGHRLGDEEDGGRTDDRHQMGLYKTSGGH